MLAFLAVVLVLFAIGRYGEVTAPALYGREINLYWDAQHVGALAGMLTGRRAGVDHHRSAQSRSSSRSPCSISARDGRSEPLDEALRDRRAQIGFGVAASVLIALFVVQRLDDRVPRVPQFSTPVSHTYAVQIARVLDTFASSRAARALPASPPLQANLAAPRRPRRARRLHGDRTAASPTTARRSRASWNPAREHFAAAVRDTGREVISTFVTSPTFGGSSWFAHSSLLSGIEGRGPRSIRRAPDPAPPDARRPRSRPPAIAPLR